MFTMSQELHPKSRTATLADHAAANVRAEMAAQRRSTSDLAKLLGVGLRAAQRRMNGDLAFALDELDVVARWLGVTRAELVRERLVRTAVA